LLIFDSGATSIGASDIFHVNKFYEDQAKPPQGTKTASPNSQSGLEADPDSGMTDIFEMSAQGDRLRSPSLHLTPNSRQLPYVVMNTAERAEEWEMEQEQAEWNRRHNDEILRPQVQQEIQLDLTPLEPQSPMSVLFTSSYMQREREAIRQAEEKTSSPESTPPPTCWYCMKQSSVCKPGKYCYMFDGYDMSNLPSIGRGDSESISSFTQTRKSSQESIESIDD
jgi:hypothetical protein